MISVTDKAQRARLFKNDTNKQRKVKLHAGKLCIDIAKQKKVELLIAKNHFVTRFGILSKEKQ